MAADMTMRTSIGPYRVIDFIGAGGMGSVYRVVHRASGQVAAAKVLNASAVGATGLERFRNEARIHQTLVHPQIAQVHEYLEVDGVPCLVMEFVEGDTLEERLRRNGPMPLADALSIFAALVDAVSYVHQRGIVHRDLKTNNVKLPSGGGVKLLDFGIAMAPGGARLTSTGNVVGTLQSLAPEQLTTGRAEPRSDIWALGIVLYEMLTGTVPFIGNAPGLLGERILKGSYIPPSQQRLDLPRDIDRIVARCLRVRPDDRYATAEALLTDVRALSGSGEKSISGSWLANRDAAALINTSGEMARSMARQWRLLLSGVAAVLSLVFLVWSMQPSAEGRGTTPDVPPRTVTPRAAALDVDDVGGRAVGPRAAEPGGTPMSLRRITIRVLEGEAEVLRDGKVAGVTPYALDAAVGTEVSLVLRRAGCDDTPIRLRVAEGMDAIMESMRRCRVP